MLRGTGQGRTGQRMQISSYFRDGNLAMLADVVLAQDIGSLQGRGSDLIGRGLSD